MGYASRSGRARTSSRNPQAHAICDRCGARYNHVDLRWQFDYAGGGLINTRILVCSRCEDVPQNQLRALTIPADPTPILNPRVQDFVQAETDYRTTQGNTTDPVTGLPIPGGDQRITEDDAYRVPQQTGYAQGSLNTEPGTDPDAPGNDDPGLPYGNTEVPKTTLE